jgi:peptidoglycan hydrolase-like protein with peptidoglycan-binding domain
MYMFLNRAKLFRVAPLLFLGLLGGVALFFGIVPSAHAVDTTPPSAPTNLTAVSDGTSEIDLTWKASTDNVGVTGYDVNRDGAHWAITASPSYSDSGMSPGTTHTYTVDAYDAAHNVSGLSNTVSATTVPVSDLTPPVARILSPAPNSKATGTVMISVSATDNVGVVKTELYLDGKLNQSDTSGVSPLSFSIDTTVLPNGNHTVFVKAYDGDGNIGTSGFITIIVSNTILPTLSASLAASTLSGTAPLTMSLTAQVAGTATGTVNYYFYCNRPDTGTNVTSPYDLEVSASTNTTYIAQDVCTYPAQGTYTVKVIAERGIANPSQAQKTVLVAAFPAGTYAVPAGAFKIDGVAITNITDTTAVVTITTNQTSSIQMRYGPTTSYGQSTSQSPELTTIHENLSGLTASTVYDFVLIATPYGAQYPAYSPNYVFTTGAPGTVATSTDTSSADIAAVNYFPRNVIIGDSGPDVNLLQVELENLGYLPATLTPTGYFGPATQHALLLFQNAHQLNKSGYLDIQSQALFNKIVASDPSVASVSPSPTPTPVSTPAALPTTLTQSLGPGSSGPQVTLLQQILTNDQDYSGPITGTYGPLTTAAVEAFQIKSGIATFGTPQTTGFGAVGPHTMSVLNNL